MSGYVRREPSFQSMRVLSHIYTSTQSRRVLGVDLQLAKPLSAHFTVRRHLDEIQTAGVLGACPRLDVYLWRLTRVPGLTPVCLHHDRP